MGRRIASSKKFKPQINNKVELEQDIVEEVSKVIPVIAVILVLDGTRAATDGVLRGCGRQGIGALILLFSYYVIGMSCAVPMMMLTDLRLMGFWLGICFGTFASVILSILFLRHLDWDKEAVKARQRVLLAEESKTTTETTSLLHKEKPRRRHPHEPRSCSTNFEILAFNPKVSDAQFRRECFKRGLIFFLCLSIIAVSLALRFTVLSDFVESRNARNETSSLVLSNETFVPTIKVG